MDQTDPRRVRVQYCHPHPNRVEQVIISNSTITVLSADFCEQFVFMEEFLAERVLMQSILPDAFHNCAKLQLISLANNHIKHIHPELFRYNSRLYRVDLSYNEIEFIHPYIFSYKTKLVYLVLNHNSINNFTPLHLGKSYNLSSIKLNDNSLEYFRIEELLDQKFFPNLVEFTLNNNKFTKAQINDMAFLIKRTEIITDIG